MPKYIIVTSFPIQMDQPIKVEADGPLSALTKMGLTVYEESRFQEGMESLKGFYEREGQPFPWKEPRTLAEEWNRLYEEAKKADDSVRGTTLP
jgi:hypothetical protein